MLDPRHLINSLSLCTQVIGMLYRHDSPALEHGVKSGDILHFVDGEPVHSKSEEDVTAMLKGPCYIEVGWGGEGKSR